MPSVESRFLSEFGYGAHLGCRCQAPALAAGFGGENAEAHYPPSLELEPVHININIIIDIKNETLTGKVTHTIQGNGAGARTIKLNAVDFQDLKLGGGGHSHAYDGETLEVT